MPLAEDGLGGQALSYGEALKVLSGRGQGIKPGLGRIQALAGLLDHPERTYPAIQVAGTNGKSSTAWIIGAILSEHGLATAVYTSPHLQSPRERFQLFGPGCAQEMIGQEEFAAEVQYLLPFTVLVEEQLGEPVTYFELATAMAFEWMSNRAVAAGVFECGLGGTWDATNIVDGEVAVLAPIAVDHARFLGTTPIENAREKSGIVKPGARVVSSPQEPEVAAHLRAVAEDRGASLQMLGSEIELASNRPAVSGRLIDVKAPRGSYEEVFVPLLGSHQGVNAALAIGACEAFLGRELNHGALESALAKVRSPGRMEIVRRDPLVVLDGAHNPAGASALALALREAFGTRRAVFVVSVFEDKDIDAVLEAFAPAATSFVLTASRNPRAASPGRLAAAPAVRAHDLETAPSIPAAIERALQIAGDDQMVVVAGSLAAAGEARDHLVGPLA